MSKPPKVATPSPSSGAEVKNPDRFGSDPMHLHQTMMEVLKETTTNTAKLEGVTKKLDDVAGKLDGLRQRFALFIGGAVVATVLLSAFGVVLWWLVGSQVTDLKNEVLRRLPPAAASTTSPDSKK